MKVVDNLKIYSITEAAKMLGISYKTIYRWEKAGLLEKPKRLKHNNRYYTYDDIVKIREIFLGNQPTNQ